MLLKMQPPAPGKLSTFSLGNICDQAKEGVFVPCSYLLWLEEEGLPTAEEEAKEKAFEGEMDKEAVMSRAMGNWRRLSMEEKAIWRKRAEELANINKK